jgi:hypothetical protein
MVRESENIAYGSESCAHRWERVQAMAKIERARSDLECRVRERTEELVVADEESSLGARVPDTGPGIAAAHRAVVTVRDHVPGAAAEDMAPTGAT